MIFIGITGGVGAGKSAILSYIGENYHSRIMLADKIAHDVMEPGGLCYDALRGMFYGNPIWQDDGSIDRPALAALLFSDDERREALNSLVHPAVKEYVRQQYALEAECGILDVLVLEAALLIEENYGEICDELWYIYTDEKTRRQRLKDSRGYSDEKIDAIMASQLSDAEFRAASQAVIDNNGSPEETYRQIDELFKRFGVIRKSAQRR